MFKKPRNKWRNKKLTIDGIVFASTTEAYYYYSVIKPKIERKEITNFVPHPKFVIIENFFDKVSGKTVRGNSYIADFQYDAIDEADPSRLVRTYIIEIKGYPTPEYKLKWKLFLQQYCQNDSENRKALIPILIHVKNLKIDAEFKQKFLKN